MPVFSDELPSIEWIPFHYSLTAKRRSGRGVHFFEDDYQFRRCWTDPDRYGELMRKFDCVLSPDFSLYTDSPVALQIYNHYRKHWLAAFWQTRGVHVIPTICWSTPGRLRWCFDGEPRNSVVAVSSVGTQKHIQTRKSFITGYYEMLEQLHPTAILFFGNVPTECTGNILQVKPWYDKFVKS